MKHILTSKKLNEIYSKVNGVLVFDESLYIPYALISVIDVIKRPLSTVIIKSVTNELLFKLETYDLELSAKFAKAIAEELNNYYESIK